MCLVGTSTRLHTWRDVIEGAPDSMTTYSAVEIMAASASSAPKRRVKKALATNKRVPKSTANARLVPETLS